MMILKLNVLFPGGVEQRSETSRFSMETTLSAQMKNPLIPLPHPLR